MSDTPRRRLMDLIASSPTLVGIGTTFVGNLTCGGDLAIAGTVRGDAAIKGLFTLADGAHWEGNVAVENAMIAGEFYGKLVVAQKLEIRKTARIRGALQARVIAVAEGAVVEGEMAVTSGEPLIRFTEKRNAE
jgi:cytoskeletal protein CcmA (bactofilin family)